MKQYVKLFNHLNREYNLKKLQAFFTSDITNVTFDEYLKEHHNCDEEQINYIKHRLWVK